MAHMGVPVATYRLQFNDAFRFPDAKALVPYLQRLGVSDLYASPLFAAVSGSTHGYDVTDPLRLNPRLGTEREFEALTQELRDREMGLLLDIVPNHMAASPENPWWADVLENGPGSPYAPYFDIDWQATKAGADEEGKLLLPILGRPIREVLESGELALTLDEQGLCLRYDGLRLPLAPTSYRAVLEYCLDSLTDALGAAHPAVEAVVSLVEAASELPERADAAAAIKRRLVETYRAHEVLRDALDENLRRFADAKGDPEGRERMERLLADQAYRLAFWRTGTREINYRRFFDVSGLVGVRVEDDAVFEATHELVLRLAREGKITGLRVDHIDGLHDPSGYLRRLQRQLAPATTAEGSTPGFSIIVEKILTGDETLPDEWPVSGTTGYDFLNTVNGVFVDGSGLQALDATYAELVGRAVSFPDEVYERKRQVAEELFEGELLRLARELRHLAGQDAGVGDTGPGDTNEQALAQALLETSACLPVYRTYVRDFDLSPQDRRYLERALAEARRRNPAVRAAAFDFLRRVLMLDVPAALSDETRHAWLRFVMRWQQFTGPLTAKGLEDTALYRYSRLLSVNEVGADPEAMGALDVSTFHRRNEARLQRWPATLNATATHDTKRGEDVRARINVLSELPDEWSERLKRWAAWNRDRKQEVDGELVPDANEELLLYQTMIGAWPLDEEEAPAFGERLKAYAIKAAREAKLHTSWLDPDEAYERALTEFVEAVLAPSKENEFLPDLLSFQKKVAYSGAMNSLAQLVLKIASPGVPDLYQGTELWDFSLVDPDNRRPVDFEKRARLLESLTEREANGRRPLVRELLAGWPDGRIKLYITMRALNARRADADLFLSGDYLPLSASGLGAAHTIAFARRRGEAWALVAVPRFAARLAAEGEPPVGEAVWGESALALPDGAPTRWRNVFTGESLEATAAGRTTTLPLRSAMAELPVCLLLGVSGGG